MPPSSRRCRHRRHPPHKNYHHYLSLLSPDLEDVLSGENLDIALVMKDMLSSISWRESKLSTLTLGINPPIINEQLCTPISNPCSPQPRPYPRRRRPSPNLVRPRIGCLLRNHHGPADQRLQHGATPPDHSRLACLVQAVTEIVQSTQVASSDYASRAVRTLHTVAMDECLCRSNLLKTSYSGQSVI